MEESKTDKAGKKSAAEDTQLENRVSQIARLKRETRHGSAAAAAE